MTRLLLTFGVRSQPTRDYLRGAASVFDLRGDTRRHYNMARSPVDADRLAIANDWYTVAHDLSSAVDAVAERLPE